ncbi:MAG: 50S ribosomal protein L11 methyltransferase [Deltaproteobacteria bacterium]|nr:50S ribosomal protein L11 methyltransferase [Deltaproteobacteria bacterium]
MQEGRDLKIEPDLGGEYFCLTIDVPVGAADMMTGVLFSLGARGIESLSRDLKPMPGSIPPAGGMERMQAYFPADGSLDKQELEARIQAHLSVIPAESKINGAGVASIQDVEKADWSKLWRNFFKPINVGKKIFLRPSWEKAGPEEQRIEIVLDPGMAFGTGTHETTRLCLEWIEQRSDRASVLDIGTGSGILAIAAARLGARKVTAVENDDTSFLAAKKNIGVNRVSDLVELVKDIDLVKHGYQVVVANILAHTLIRMAPGITRLVSENGELALSGILFEQAGSVKESYLQQGFKTKKINRMGEWVLLELGRET